jgi:hypothetical protein
MSSAKKRGRRFGFMDREEEDDEGWGTLFTGKRAAPSVQRVAEPVAEFRTVPKSKPLSFSSGLRWYVDVGEGRVVQAGALVPGTGPLEHAGFRGERVPDAFLRKLSLSALTLGYVIKDGAGSADTAMPEDTVVFVRMNDDKKVQHALTEDQVHKMMGQDDLDETVGLYNKTFLRYVPRYSVGRPANKRAKLDREGASARFQAAQKKWEEDQSRVLEAQSRLQAALRAAADSQRTAMDAFTELVRF